MEKQLKLICCRPACKTVAVIGNLVALLHQTLSLALLNVEYNIFLLCVKHDSTTYIVHKYSASYYFNGEGQQEHTLLKATK